MTNPVCINPISLRANGAGLCETSRTLLNAVPFPIAIFNCERKIVFANHALLSTFRDSDTAPPLSLNELRGAFRLLDPKSGALVEPEKLPLSRALQGETVEHEEYRAHVVRPGRRIWIECGAVPLKDGDGNISGVVLSVRDITKTKERDVAMESSSQLRDLILHEDLAGILQTTVDGRILDCSRGLLRIWGFESRAELFAMRAGQLYCDPADRDRMLGLLAESGRLNHHEVCIRRKDGSRGWALFNLRLIEPAAAETGATIIGTAVDITERRLQEETLRQSEQRFAAFMRHLPGVAFIKDPAGRYVFYNESSVAQFGMRPESIVGKTDEQLWPGEDARRYRENDLILIDSKRPVEYVEQVMHADGAHSWLIYKFPILEGDRVAFVCGVGIDITERRILEEQLGQARKMEALGKLAGGIAHDFNNLLTVISGYGQIAIEGVGNTPPDRMITYLQEILNSSLRASSLTGQLLAFSRQQAVEPKVLDLGDLVRNMERLLQRVIGEHVELAVRCSAEPLLIRADVSQMEQVVMNLAVNARDAMPLGGTLEVRCELLPNPIERQGEDPLRIVLEVRDTGVGMDKKILTRIFDPFFTSKELGKGTGLGLSTVYGIVTQSRGTVAVESTPGQGTLFRICFPAAPAPTESAAPAAVPKQSGRGAETVLLVEDEPAVRLLAEMILKRLGYTVLVADGGPAAVSIWEKRAGKVDVLLTDVIMPHMSGGDLAQKLREAQPRLKVLFMSGYTDDMLAGHGVLGGETQLIQKPFTAEALGRKLRDVLDA